ncbi:MAG TPA: SAM-dependent methyltransferase [Epulopiscium sp.]|nr:SAM-dependent methyltransferase [Candidatus Epulonipiscium sp.]
MQNLQNMWHEIIKDESLISATFSNVRNKNEILYTQVKIKPILIKEQLYYHLEYIFEKKVAHENLQLEEFSQSMIQLSTLMKQINIYTTHHDYQVMISKKMKVTIIKKVPSKHKEPLSLSHNRKKQYLFEEGIPVPFLIELGVMSKEGMVVKSKYNKFRQINRFVELVKDVAKELPQNKKLRIIDFGCGKSYLTFALHYYLKVLCGLDIEVVGLDLKQDVINTCNNLVSKLALDNIKFLVGDIEQYTEYNQVDMVVTLHACNTATDAALAKAIRWNAKVILSVPCCHHELYTQMENEILAPLLDHGIIKERFAALATDGIRTQILEILGYRTQLVEFIDMEHTPKNILIRAIKADNTKDLKLLITNYHRLTSFLSVSPSLENMLKPELSSIGFNQDNL